MRSALRTYLTLAVIALLFLAFNLVWIPKLPDVMWDFSRQNVHTLSPAARQLLTSLEHPLDLYYFNASHAPERSYALNRYGKRIEDLLKQYEKAAKGMINLHIIEPAPFSEDAYKAELFGLDDKAGFLGLIGTRAGQGAQRIESFNLDREPLLEYEIGHLIYKLQHPERPVVGLLPGVPMEESAGRLMKELHRHFDLATLDSTIVYVPAQIKTLMVVHPQALSEQALYAVEQFVLRGGKLIAFIDPVSEIGADTPLLSSRLDELLAAWGIHMPRDKLLVDKLYGASAIAGAGKPVVRHPAVLNLPRQAMNTHDISTWKLDTVTVSSSGALFPHKKSQTTFTPLLHSSVQSALIDTTLFSDATASGPSPDTLQRHVIAARIEGLGHSAFPEGFAGTAPALQKTANIHVVVVADTDLLADTFNNGAADSNALFILNTLDNFSAPDVLASIRPRAVAQKSPTALQTMRNAAELAYREQAVELEQRLLQTEQEWRLLSPQGVPLGTQAVDSTTQLQALNKERLRLPMELHALQVEAYAQVHRLEQSIKLVLILAIPLTLCLVSWLVFLSQLKRRSRAGSLFQ
ncbi:ABC transporter [Pseudomonas nabeulensis]|uniref:ABC transporter n=1 Tax=Pseudomonas nabeulensis TaxID=2293833 RepID=A0A4Z0B0X3_9PSED|nr:Gldg family protein [Pseudomonas nabeulensis]TFY92263.1 ABC transporter [Pseudomonas nabeulensis]